MSSTKSEAHITVEVYHLFSALYPNWQFGDNKVIAHQSWICKKKLKFHGMVIVKIK